jgi:hypothetical protein
MLPPGGREPVGLTSDVCDELQRRWGAHFVGCLALLERDDPPRLYECGIDIDRKAELRCLREPGIEKVAHLPNRFIDLAEMPKREKHRGRSRFSQVLERNAELSERECDNGPSDNVRRVVREHRRALQVVEEPPRSRGQFLRNLAAPRINGADVPTDNPVAEVIRKVVRKGKAKVEIEAEDEIAFGFQ